MPLAALTLLIGVFFWKLLTRQYTWMDHPDMAYQVLPWLQFQAASWHRGIFPMWDPHVWGGQPLIGQMQPGAAYPLNWILFLMPLSNGYIQTFWVNLYFVFTHLLAGWFAFALCRDLGRTAWASVLGGLAFSLSGIVGSLGWPQMLNGAIWIPLVLLFFFRVVRDDRPMASAILAGGFLGISFLSGHHQIPAFTVLALTIFWGWLLWERRSAALRPAIAFIVMTALSGAFQAIPAYETGLRSIRWVGSQNPVFWGQSVPYLVHEQFSLAPVELIGLAVGGTRNDLFVGLTLVILAGMGLARFVRPSQTVRLLATLFVIGVVLALGAWSMFHGAAYLVFPLIEKARTPAMALVLAQTGIAILAAFGLDALREINPKAWLVRTLGVLGVLPWLLLAVLSAWNPASPTQLQPLGIVAIVAAAAAGLLHALGTKLLSVRAVSAALIALTLFELSTVITRNYHHRESPGGFLSQLETGAEIAAFLRAQPDFVRLEVDTNSVPFNIGDWEGIDVFRAYLGGMTNNVARLEKDRLAGGDRALRLFALTHFVGKEPVRQGQVEIFQAKSGLKVFRNPEAGSLATFEGSQPQCAGTVQVLERDPHRALLRVQNGCPGNVTLSQTYFPGWHANVDGKDIPVQEVQGVLQGARLEAAGTHTVEFRYRPWSVFTGAALTAVGIAVMAVAGMKSRAAAAS